MRTEEALKLLAAQDFAADGDGFVRGSGGLGEELHQAEREHGAELGLGFGDKTEAAGSKGGEDGLEGEGAIGEDEEEAGGDDGVDLMGKVGKGEGICAEESTVLETTSIGLAAGAGEQGFG